MFPLRDSVRRHGSPHRIYRFLDRKTTVCRYGYENHVTYRGVLFCIERNSSFAPFLSTIDGDVGEPMYGSNHKDLFALSCRSHAIHERVWWSCRSTPRETAGTCRTRSFQFLKSISSSALEVIECFQLATENGQQKLLSAARCSLKLLYSCSRAMNKH